MQGVSPPDLAAEIAPEMDRWRAAALRKLLVVMAVAAAPVLGVATLAACNPERRPVALVYVAAYLCALSLAAARRLSPRLRAWGLVLSGYAAGVLTLVLGGRSGDGGVVLLAVPVAAFILIGLRPGLLMAALSLLALVVVGVADHLGWISPLPVGAGHPSPLAAWLAGGAVVGLCLAVLIVLQGHALHFLTRLAVEKTRLLNASRTSEALYWTFSELTSDFVYVVRVGPDGDLTVEWAHDKFAAVVGFSPAELEN